MDLTQISAEKEDFISKLFSQRHKAGPETVLHGWQLGKKQKRINFKQARNFQNRIPVGVRVSMTAWRNPSKTFHHPPPYPNHFFSLLFSFVFPLSFSSICPWDSTEFSKSLTISPSLRHDSISKVLLYSRIKSMLISSTHFLVRSQCWNSMRCERTSRTPFVLLTVETVESRSSEI